MGKGFIAIFRQHIQSKLKCVVINIYAACTVKDKLALWDDLTNVKNAYQNFAWVLCRDFNAVRCGDERKGACATSPQRKEIFGFNDFIERNFLVELPIVGKRYTWFKANGSAKSRLDRVFVSDEWLLKWPTCKQYVQPRVVSDHCTIVVKSVVKDWGPKPFRSIDAWLLEPGFLAMVKEKWDSYSVQGNYFSRLKDMLKNLKADLKVWNRDVFGCMETNKKKILKEIDDLDTLDDCADLDDCAKQKRWRRLRNEVKGVEVGNQWCEEPEVVRKEAKKLFEERFQATTDFGVRLSNVDFKTLSPVCRNRLIASFTEEEVKAAVWECEGSKSPSPDGFNFNFLKNCWDFLKKDIMDAIHHFEATGCVPKGCKASFIALVPKIREPLTLDQYRPFSLVGAIYKIITKVLAGRIKSVLPTIIDVSQTAFLKGRGLLDTVLVANEVVEDLRRYGRRGVCLKVDFEKAYDSVRWAFLLDMLNRLGFHSKWISWIKGCLESSSVSVLVNGSPTEEFKPSRGLRQGDPLAPFLFLIVVEGLSRLVRQANKLKILNGVKVGRCEAEVCVSQFADDKLFMCDDSYRNIITIKAILRGFEIASGLKVNFHKSKLAGINVECNSLALYAKTLNCTLMRVPFKYLGLEVGGNPRKKQF